MLDGALALALPAKFGQNLHVEPNSNNTLVWKSYTKSNAIWFEAIFEASSLKMLQRISYQKR